ncbi:serine protease [Evansella sp. AB-P1]|uniref:S1C family serine protease n=1 Tax=Evansella sp. AB-P1 TaxID=3037653 RepID=UPI00241C5CB2|nr:serine protease [Evansella sp. AB-P1]MDG5788371.1 serine protease [Evansella sp. AB-P1]
MIHLEIGGIHIKEYNKDKDKNTTSNIDGEKTDKKEEKLFFDGEKYYTMEEFFNPEEEETEEIKEQKKSRKKLKVLIASILTIALLSNVFALWPRIINLSSIQFLAISIELSQDEQVQLYKESVVVVRAGDSKGTGFYISDDGYIMTNHHVVDNPGSLTVSFEGGERYGADIVSSDEEIDIAILQIDTGDKNHPVLQFDETWEQNMPIYVIGNPLFFNFIANKGNIIGSTPEREVPMLMIDAPIYRGNSGSPVINEEGNVVGVVFATTRIEVEGSRQRVGLAVPVEYFREYLPFED